MAWSRDDFFSLKKNKDELISGKEDPEEKVTEEIW